MNLVIHLILKYYLNTNFLVSNQFSQNHKFWCMHKNIDIYLFHLLQKCIVTLSLYLHINIKQWTKRKLFFSYEPLTIIKNSTLKKDSLVVQQCIHTHSLQKQCFLLTWACIIKQYMYFFIIFIVMFITMTYTTFSELFCVNWWGKVEPPGVTCHRVLPVYKALRCLSYSCSYIKQQYKIKMNGKNQDNGKSWNRNKCTEKMNTLVSKHIFLRELNADFTKKLNNLTKSRIK